MSRFFAGGSESDTSSSSDSESERESRFKSSAKSVKASAFLQFSDDEEDQQRVVRSAKEKRYEQLHNIIKSIRNSKKIKDFNKMETSFQELTKAYDKARPVIAKEENDIVPSFYIAILVEMEDLVNETWEDKDGRKNMNKNNSKSLSTLRQKLRKYVRDQFDAEMTKYRESPGASGGGGGDAGATPPQSTDDDSTDDSDKSDDDEIAVSSKKSGVAKKQVTISEPTTRFGEEGEEDDSDDSLWGNMSDDSESSSSDDEGRAGLSLRERFLKKNTKSSGDVTSGVGEGGGTDGDAFKKKERKERRTVKKTMDEGSDDEDGGWKTVEQRGTMEKPKMFDKDSEINHETVVRKLDELISARVRRKTNRREQLELLEELQTIATQHELGPAIDIKIHLATMAAIFDHSSGKSSQTPMKNDYWLRCLSGVEEMLDLIRKHMKDVEIVFDNEAVIHMDINFENLSSKPYRIVGSYLSMVESLDEELRRILKACDAHATEYVERLSDESKVVSILNQCQSLLEFQKECHPSTVNNDAMCRIYIRKLEHIYFKFDPKVEQIRGDLKKQKVEVGGYGCDNLMFERLKSVDLEKRTSTDEMDELCKYIYANDSTDRLRTRAILAQVYHHAIHDAWFEARDLMLMSHLQDTISCSDPETQILYNRTMVQLGLCAFRHGEIKDSHQALQDIQLTGRSKELLAQGLLPLRYHERTAEQEKTEKQRQLPFHMHINLEVIECVYLVSAMLQEVPYLAAHSMDGRKKMISRGFYTLMKASERQPLVGPPESMRDHVAAAAKAMRRGQWAKCLSSLINPKMNAKVWDLFHDSDGVRGMLKNKIQEEALRTYLFTFSKNYDSISLDKLCALFELPRRRIDAIVCKMMITGQLMASLDEPTGCVVMHKTEPSNLHALALQLADKLATLVENNERLLDFRSSWQSSHGYHNQRGGGGDNQVMGPQWRSNNASSMGGHQSHNRNHQGGGGGSSSNHRGGRGGNRGWGGGGQNKRYNNNMNNNKQQYNNNNSRGQYISSR